jgi:hypothetical protein
MLTLFAFYELSLILLTGSTQITKNRKKRLFSRVPWGMKQG